MTTLLLALAWLAIGVPVSRRMTWVFQRATALHLPATEHPRGDSFDGPVCGNCGGRYDYHPGGRWSSLRNSGRYRACNTFTPNTAMRKSWSEMYVPRRHFLSALVATVTIPLWPVALVLLAMVWVGPRWAIPIETRQESIARRLADAEAMNAETDRIMREIGDAS